MSEQPLFLDAGTHRTFAMATCPATPAATGVALLAGAGIASVGNARLWVTLARELAARGHWVLRIDHRGTGESTGDVGELDLTEPFTADAMAALDWLSPRAPEGVILVGECFGARTALDCAGGPLRPLGVVMLFPPTGRAPAETQDLSGKLRRAMAAGVPLVAVYGHDDVDRPVFEALASQIGVNIAVEPGKLHGIASIEARDAVRRQVLRAVDRFGAG